jgi:acylphosphatase
VNDESGRLEATVRGDVQGVGFRYFVLRRANALGLRGWVANEPDRTVRCVAEGPSHALDELLEVVGRGPPGARVDDVTASRSPATGSFDRFSVRASGHRGD